MEECALGCPGNFQWIEGKNRRRLAKVCRKFESSALSHRVHSVLVDPKSKSRTLKESADGTRTIYISFMTCPGLGVRR
jgi:hypothetical protein